MANRRIFVPRKGGPQVLKLEEVEIPEPSEGQVRIKVQASGVAFADILMREGLYPAVKPPCVPGYDVYGVVDAVGEGVDGIEQGDRAAAMTVHGGYADYVCADSRWTVKVEKDPDPSVAVSLVLNYLTAYQLLHRSAHVSKGERVLVHGAAGGVGTALLQLGADTGLEMYGTASAGKHSTLEQYGAKPIDYRKYDFVQWLKDNDVRGLDAVFDPIGGEVTKKSFSCLRNGGRLVGYGFQSFTSGGRADTVKAAWTMLTQRKFNMMELLSGSKSVCGYSVSSLAGRCPDWFREDLSNLFSLLAEKRIHPVVADRIPLEEASRAHELLGMSAITGKIVLTH